MMRKSKKGKESNKFIKHLKGLKRKEKLLLFTSVLIFTFLIIQELVIRPLNNKQNNLKEEEVALNENKVDALYGINKQDELKIKLNDITYDYNKILSELPRTEKQAEILNELTTISNETNIKLTDISFGNEDRILKVDDNDRNLNSNIENNSNEIDGTSSNETSNKTDKSKLKKDDVLVHSAIFKVTGSFENLVDFIKRIEKTKRKININNLKIEKTSLDENGNIKNILQATINIEYYNLNYKENEKYDFNKGTYGKQNYFQ
ncbi:hypothetical protein [Clostridium sardiniense]|uniref:hypothetical protein n=1 Tax=Clostridium sardiniense TaxID=29369 RepID=UPI001956E848|nr:hypothetical protein [Clostridium sardiniense]